MPNDGVYQARKPRFFSCTVEADLPRPTPRCPVTSFPYHNLWQFHFFFTVVQSKNLNASLTPIFISYLHLIVKEILSIPPKNINRVQTVLTAATASPLPNPLFHAWIIIITIALIASTASSFIIRRIIRNTAARVIFSVKVKFYYSSAQNPEMAVHFTQASKESI